MREAVEESPVRTVRRLMREALRASLGTLVRDSGGAPYVSLVLIATDHDGAPILLLSDLADHTRNVGRDARISLLLDGTGEREEPLAGERVTLQGRLRRSEEPRHRARFLARHPSAETYADFRDFAFYRMEVERAHLVAGFGRIHWLNGANVLITPCAALVDAEPAIVQHMNDDHCDALQLYARQLLGRDGEGWRMVGIDPEGCDLRLGPRTARLVFGREVTDAATAGVELVDLVGQARARLDGSSAIS
jgi:putative heme iron utilization protein